MPESGATAEIDQGSGIDLYWLPLGAGGHFLKYNGRLYEWIKAHVERRRVCDLYHSALQVELPEGRSVIEQTPEPDLSGADRGVVAEGPVGSRRAGWFRLFRYEIRVWHGGHIPDVAEAVDSPQRLSSDEATWCRTLTDRLAGELSPQVRERVAAAFLTSSRLRARFWQMAWEGERWLA